jgi:hypothetical protein
MSQNPKKRARTRNRAQRNKAHHTESLPDEGLSWLEGDGVHALLPGERPSEELLQKTTEAYQRSVAQIAPSQKLGEPYGKASAIEMLRECRVELK